MRDIRIVRPVTALLAVAAACALDSQPQVQVRDFALDPMGNLSYHDERVVLHPKALLGLGADSNVYATHLDQREDTFIEGLVGLEGRYDIGDSQRLTGTIELEHRRWQSEDERNMTGGRARLGYLHDDGAGRRTNATAGYALIDDPLIESGVRVKRGVTDAGADLTWEGRVLRLGGGLAFVGEHFFDDGLSFTAHERQNRRISADGSAGWRYASNAEAFARLVPDVWHYVNESSRYRNSNGLKAMVGWRAAPSTRIKVQVEAGAEARHYSGYYNDDPSYGDKDTVTPAGSLDASYAWEEGSSATLRGYSHMVSATTANGSLLMGLDADLRYRLRTKAALLAKGQVYQLTDSGSAAGQPVEQRDTCAAYAGLEYLLREGVGIRLLAGYEHSMARIGEDYDRWSGSLVTAFAY